jgi:S-adenosylmethionine:tRNA ribosyltransferase-isomerase
VFGRDGMGRTAAALDERATPWLVAELHRSFGSAAERPIKPRITFAIAFVSGGCGRSAAARMLHLLRNGELQDGLFRHFPDLLRPDDLLVLNNTRVFPARVFGRRKGANAQMVSQHNPAARTFLQGEVEVLLTKQISQDPNEWECLVRPGKKIGVGERLFLGPDGDLEAEVIGRGEFGERRIRFGAIRDFFSVLERVGHVPLPPYIGREDSSADRERYQTVYANERGSVAAPTAGLHFTPEILRTIRARGIEIAEITLHVGLGTFQPIHAELVEDGKADVDHAAQRIARPLVVATRLNRSHACQQRAPASERISEREPMPLHYARLAGEPGTEPELPLPSPSLFFSKEKIKETTTKFDIQGSYSVLCPGAEYGPAKRWPARHFATLAAAKRAQGAHPLNRS